MSSPTGSNASAGIVLVAVSWTFFVVSLFVVCLRFYADFFFVIHLVRTDSYLSFLTFVSHTFPQFYTQSWLRTDAQAQMLVIVSQVFTHISVHYGLGTHIDALTPNAIVLAVKYCWVAQPFQLLAIAFGKIAAVTYLATIHGPRNANIKQAFLWIVGLVQLFSCFIILGFIYSQCSAMAKLWNIEIPGTCNGRTRNVYMAYPDGSESSIALARDLGDDAKQIGLFAFSNLGISLYPTLIF